MINWGLCYVLICESSYFHHIFILLIEIRLFYCLQSLQILQHIQFRCLFLDIEFVHYLQLLILSGIKASIASSGLSLFSVCVKESQVIKSFVRCKIVIRTIRDYIYQHIDACSKLIPQYFNDRFVHIFT